MGAALAAIALAKQQNASRKRDSDASARPPAVTVPLTAIAVTAFGELSDPLRVSAWTELLVPAPVRPVMKMSHSFESERRFTSVAQSITCRSIFMPIASSCCLKASAPL